MSDRYSFSKHVTSVYYTTGPVLGVRDTKLNKTQTQSSMSSVREVRAGPQQLTQCLVENASGRKRQPDGTLHELGGGKGHSGQELGRRYFTVTFEC